MENKTQFDIFWSLLTSKLPIADQKEAVRSIMADSYPETPSPITRNIDEILSEIVDNVKKETQWTNKSRIVGEAFERLFLTQSCPSCHTKGHLEKYIANKKSKDVVCGHCQKQFQVKSCQKATVSTPLSLIGAEYKTTLTSIKDDVIDYIIYLYSVSGSHFHINNVLLVKNHDISDSCIVPRKPLSAKAKRAGWQGCTLKFNKFESINFC